jgi:hypothetical protein
MPKQLFNEPELCLLRKWSDVLVIEESIKSVRKTYAELFNNVLEQIQEKHPELDRCETHLTKEGVNIGIGKDAWYVQQKPKFWISGLWLGGIRVENLTSDDEEMPYKMILLNAPKNAENLERAKEILPKAAKNILSELELTHLETCWGSGQASIFYPISESREKLFDMLLADGSQKFIDCMIAQFESMMEFVSAIDDLFL